MRHLILILTTVLIFGIASAASAQEWVKFEPEGGGFEVVLPGTPQKTTNTQDSEYGPYTTTTYVLRAGAVVYLLGYADYAPTFNFDVKSELAANRDNFLKGFKDSKLLAEKEISLPSNPGIEFTADISDGRFVTSRVYIVGRRPYQLMAATTKGADQAGVVKFLDSFRITPK